MKKAIMFIVTLALCVTGCDAEPGVPSEPETEPVISNMSAEDCFLCGSGAEEPCYWGQNNVGIISLNTFEVMPLEINRYDAHGTLIEEEAGYVQTGGFQNPENGFSAYMMVNPDSGYATGQISFREDEKLDVEKTATFLCQDCLDAVLSEIHEKGFGVGVINFATREIHASEKNFTGFGLGDFTSIYATGKIGMKQKTHRKWIFWCFIIRCGRGGTLLCIPAEIIV